MRCIALACAVAALVAAGPRTPDLVVRNYLAARSRAARMQWLAPDYRFWFLTPDGPGEGAAEHLKTGWDSELHDTLRPDSVGVDGSRVTVRVHEDNDFSRLIAYPGWDALVTCTLDDHERIETELYVPRPGAPSWKPYLERALPWLRRHRASSLAWVYAGGKLVETRRSAREWRSILRAWRAAGSPDSGLGR